MLLKRLYDEKKNVRGVRVLRAGPKQHFSPKMVERAVSEGWMSLAAGRITVNAEPEAVVYQIKAAPGYYCCHCNRLLGDGPSGRAHVKEAHKGEQSPDPGNPAGYRKDNFYACEKE